jgi:hypothetical protein
LIRRQENDSPHEASKLCKLEGQHSLDRCEFVPDVSAEIQQDFKTRKKAINYPLRREKLL